MICRLDIAEQLGQAGVTGGVFEIEPQVLDAGRELLPVRRVRLAGAQATAQLKGFDVGMGDRQQPQPPPDLSRPPAFQERRDELAAGQIAGRAEDYDGCDYDCCSRGRTAWPPNCCRRAASMRSENGDGSRDRKRRSRDRLRTSAGLSRSIASCTVQRPSPESAT